MCYFKYKKNPTLAVLPFYFKMLQNVGFFKSLDVFGCSGCFTQTPVQGSTGRSINTVGEKWVLRIHSVLGIARGGLKRSDLLLNINYKYECQSDRL